MSKRSCAWLGPVAVAVAAAAVPCRETALNCLSASKGRGEPEAFGTSLFGGAG